MRQKADFERLLRHGSRCNVEGFTFYVERRDRGSARLGILISRRHARRATDRNRIKRCVREAFRLEYPSLGSVDLLVRPPYGMKPTSQTLSKLRVLLAGIARQ